MIAYNRVIDAFRDYGCIVKEKRPGQASVQAPGHTSADLSVSVTAVEGQVLVYSHSDPTEDVLEKIGIQPGDLFDDPRGVEYKYGDGRIVRRTPDKRFFQDGNTQGTELYRVERVPTADEVWVTEGEKDCHTLESVGLVAVSGAGGGKNIKNFDLSPLYGKEIVLVRDKDEIGEAWADTLWSMLAAEVESIRVVIAKEGKDASDHIGFGHGVDEFVDDENFAVRMARKKLWETWQSSKDADLDSFIAAMESGIKRIRPPRPIDDRLHEWDDVNDEWWEWYSAPEDQRRVVAAPWGKLNSVIAGGFQAGRSYLFVARPGVGKSLALGNAALCAARAGHRTAIFSLEMGRIEVMSRMLADGANANYGQITKREMDEFHLTRVAEFSDSMRGQVNLVIGDTPGLSLNQLERYVDRLANSPSGLDILLVDYAQLMRGAPGLSESQANSEISQGLKGLSRIYNIPVIAAAQANRDAAKDGKAADLTGIRGSGSYEQDADVVVILDLEMSETEPKMPTGTISYILAKNRTGPLQTISMSWEPNKAAIRD